MKRSMALSLRMTIDLRAWLGLICLVFSLAACQNGDSIDDSGQVFDGIAKDDTIRLIGNEPFWGIEIAPADGSYQAIYTTPDNIDGTTIQVARFAGNNGLGFSGEIAGAPVQIAVTPGECSDTMSDRTYPFTATVAIGDTNLTGCGYSDDRSFEGVEPGD